MPDGSLRFNFPAPSFPGSFRASGEINVDLFAGGGGASEAMEQVTGRPVDIAINHDRDAVGLHAANHPFTRHACEDIYAADPIALVAGRPVGWLHGSPDCTDHSQAKGGQPRDKERRSLSWAIIKWVGKLRKRGLHPRFITLENVIQIEKWGRVIAKRDPATGRVVTLESIVDPVTGKKTLRVADPGERVPVSNQYLVPDKKAEGRQWRRFVGLLRAFGYDVQWFRLKSCDYEDREGFPASTTRTRLFLMARRDGLPICKPEPVRGPGKTPYSAAANCIDFSIPCPSIFMTKAQGKAYTKSTGTRVIRPLAEKSLRRIARGVVTQVLTSAKPFIVPNMGNNVPLGADEALPTVTTGGRHMLAIPTLLPLTHAGSDRINDPQEPLPTITGANRGEIALAQATLVEAAAVVEMAHGDGEGKTARRGKGNHHPHEPVGVIHAGGGNYAVATAHMIQMRGDVDRSIPMTEPAPTITSGAGARRPAGAAHATGVVTAHLAQVNGGFNATDSRDVRDPLSAITGTGSQQQVVETLLSPFLTEHANGSQQRNFSADEPLRTQCAQVKGGHFAAVAAHLTPFQNNSASQAAGDALGTICAEGTHHACIESGLVTENGLTPEQERAALRVAAFLIRYHDSGGQWPTLDKPITAVTTRDRLALVTVVIDERRYVVIDIGLRMLTPRELFLCQGFRPSYIIDRTADGRTLTKSASVKLVGNSVSPQPLFALGAANMPIAAMERAAA